MNFLEKYGIKIQDQELLTTALTHSSYANEHNLESYERLEFLGDAVLEISISEYIYKHTSLQEGGLSKLRASYVCENALASYAKDLDLASYIKVGHGQEMKVSDPIVADVLESVIAVIYLDLGLNAAKRFVNRLIIPYIEKNTLFFDDYKSVLQEMVQTSKKSLEYVITQESGPAHDKFFEVEVIVDGMVFGRGSGKSKKDAEQKAALDAIKKQAK